MVGWYVVRLLFVTHENFSLSSSSIHSSIHSSAPLILYVSLSLSLLTFDFEFDTVGGSRVLRILRVAGERARLSAADALQHQRLVGDYHPGRHVVGQLVVLRKLIGNKPNETMRDILLSFIILYIHEC